MTPRYCFYISGEERDERGYIPSVVYENQPGHIPLTGSGSLAEPWYWGKTYPQAVVTCALANKGLGLSEVEVIDIVASSMRLQGWD